MNTTAGNQNSNIFAIWKLPTHNSHQHLMWISDQPLPWEVAARHCVTWWPSTLKWTHKQPARQCRNHWFCSGEVVENAASAWLQGRPFFAHFIERLLRQQWVRVLGNHVPARILVSWLCGRFHQRPHVCNPAADYVHNGIRRTFRQQSGSVHQRVYRVVYINDRIHKIQVHERHARGRHGNKLLSDAPRSTPRSWASEWCDVHGLWFCILLCRGWHNVTRYGYANESFTPRRQW